jgi:hypothetical protein
MGQIHRHGQSKTSSCCGAAKGALKKLQDGLIKEGNVTDIDYQMNTIEQILLSNQDQILSATNPLFVATETIYSAIDQRIQLLLEKTKYNCKYIFLMGAILINGDSDIGSFSTAKRVEVIDLKTNKRQNLLHLYS